MQTKEKIIQAPFDSYFGVFLTLACSLNCDYCVQKIASPNCAIARYPIERGEKWVEALNAIAPRTKKRFFRPAKKKKLSITGGEPTLHPGFAYIINNLDKNWNITVTSNFDSPLFEKDAALLKQIKKRKRLKFNGSFHFLYTPLEKFRENTLKIKKAGIFVHTLFIVGHPGYMEQVQQYQKKLEEIHPLVKLQRFLGHYQGRLYPCEEGYDIKYQQQDGIFNYEDYQKGFSQRQRQSIYCRMNKVLFAPNGDIYNCHNKLYMAHQDNLGIYLLTMCALLCRRIISSARSMAFVTPAIPKGTLLNA